MRHAPSTRFILPALALFVSALAAAGCASQPVTESQKNVDTYNLARKTVADARDDVGKTLTALNQYTEKPGRSTFEDFRKNAKAAQTHGQALQNIAAVMSDQGASFFTNWEQEINAMTDKDLQTAAQAKRAAALHFLLPMVCGLLERLHANAHTPVFCFRCNGCTPFGPHRMQQRRWRHHPRRRICLPDRQGSDLRRLLP